MFYFEAQFFCGFMVHLFILKKNSYEYCTKVFVLGQTYLLFSLKRILLLSTNQKHTIFALICPNNSEVGARNSSPGSLPSSGLHYRFGQHKNFPDNVHGSV